MKTGTLSRKADLYATSRIKEAAINRGHEVHIIDHLKCDMIIEKSQLENKKDIAGKIINFVENNYHKTRSNKKNA